MKKIFSFAKKKKHPSSTPDSGSVLSVGYELKDKDLGKVHKAASGGDLSKLKQLAKKNDINQLDKENRTALHIACASGHVEVVQFLVESKAKLNLCDNQNRSALMKAVQGQHERCVSILLENHADPNLVDINGNTALHLTANIPSISTAVLLLEHEADINAQNKEGFTPLTVSVREDHIEMAEFLLKEGADVNVLDQDQRSPLMIAAGNGQIGMLRLLLQFNADITLKDTKGWSADDYAVMNGHHPCSLLIIEHGTQRNNGSSLSHQGLSKTMKSSLLGSPSRDVEGGFSVGGPAIDKDEHGANEAGRDYKDTSQSESLSRVSKSGADEWPSTDDDDDESGLIEKTVHKVNLRKMIASKKGEASLQPDRSLSSTESLPETENRAQRTPSLPKVLPSNRDSTAKKGTSGDLEQLLSSKGSHEEHAKEEDEVGEDNEDEEEEDEKENNDDEEDEDEDEDKETSDDDDEEEEEEEDEEEEEEEEESEESVGEEDEENECEDQNDNSLASVNGSTTDFECIQKPSVSGDPKMTHNADSEHVPGTNIPFNFNSIASNVDASENNIKAQTETADLVCTARTAGYSIPASLNLEQDCVVSAIRVESKFSDEDDSLGKDYIRSSDQNTSSRVSTVAALNICTDILSPNMLQEKEIGDDDGDDSWSIKQNSGETVWNDSDDEEDNQIGKFGRNTVLAKRSVLPEVDAEKTDSESQKAFKDDKHRSSWGSSVEDSDTDLPKEEGTLHQPNETPPDPSSDSPLVTALTKCVSSEQMVDEPKPSSPQCLRSISPSRNRTDESASDNSQWDSSSENIANISKNDNKNVGSSVSIANVVTSQTSEHQCPHGSWEEENNYTERVSNDPSPAVSPMHEDSINSILDRNDVKSVIQSSEIEENVDSEHIKGDDNSWDDEGENDDVELKTIDDKVVDCDDVLGSCLSPANLQSPNLRPRSALDESLQEEIDVNDEEDAQPCIEGSNNSPGGNKRDKPKLVLVKNDSDTKDCETNDDSDSKDQTLQDGSVIAKAPDVGDDSDNTAKSTEYIPVENQSTIVPPAGMLDDLEKESHQNKISTSTLTKDNQNAEETIFLEVLPKTDIDDVDLDSPDEAESIDMTSQEQNRNVEGQLIEKEDSTDNEDNNNDEEGDEERDTSNENDLLEESGHSLDTASPVHETEDSKDKKRDFLSELGLQKEDEEQDSWDSESHLDDPSVPHEEKEGMHPQTVDEIATTEDKMEETGNKDKDDTEEQLVDECGTLQKETEKAKWEPLNVLSKLEGEHDQKTDLMEELGLGDVDDLEDASDWDSASTASKRTLPGRRLAASPEVQTFPQSSAVKAPEEDINVAAPLTPQGSINPGEIPPSTPSKVTVQPQPRARMTIRQEPESEEDWEPDDITSSNTSKLEDKSSPKMSSIERDAEIDTQQQKEEYDAVGTCELDCVNSCPPDGGGKDIGLQDQCSSEDKGHRGDDAPWEKNYEKLWVEVEKREVKSTFKNVAGELKEKFGELFTSRRPAEDATEAKQETAESPAEEDSSDEEGEVIERPSARARSTVLLTIPEQRESGLEDSVTESTDNSYCEDQIEVGEPSVNRSNIQHEAVPLSGDAQEDCSFPSPQVTSAEIEINKEGVISHTLTFSDIHCNSVPKHETKPAPLHKQHVDLVRKDKMTDVEQAHLNSACLGEGSEESSKYHPPSVSRHLASVLGVSDDELEEDMNTFKLKVEEETTKTAMELPKSSTSLIIGGSAFEVDLEKPETNLRCLPSQVGLIHPEKRPAAIKRTSEAPVALQQTSSNRQQETAVERTLQLELVRGAQHGRAPQTNTLTNGDPLSVFDDSTLSELSDDEGRLTTSGHLKNEKHDEVEMAEDFDEVTQSSDTATDDMDSPTSGYRHASLLIQKLDSATLDSRSMVKLQNIFHEYERSIQKARSRHGYLSDKVNQLEMERADLRTSLEEVKDLKSDLDRHKLELQTEVTNLKFQLKQEQENRRNATMMYNTTRDKLRRTEEQHQLEIQERQKVELTLRNLELEMRTLVNNIKRLEEDHNETQRLLAQERSARALQENLLNSHLRKQQEIEEENKRNISKSSEALSQLTEASDRERELVQQTVTLQEQLHILRTELEHSQANSSLKEGHILEENEALKEQLEDARRDLKLNGEALAQTVYNCNNQMSTLKSELAIITTRLENERQTRESLESELESTRVRLAGAIKEAEQCLGAHSDSEKALLWEKEEHQRLKDRLTGEVASQREAVSSMSQKLTKEEARANSLENEVHRATLQLTEKGLLLEVLQREKDQAAARVKELDSALQAERESASHARARQDVTQERLAQAQSESMLLRQQLEESQNKGAVKERAVTDAQERFSDQLSKLRSDCEDRVQLIEERNKELASKAADFRGQILKLEEEKGERETNLRQLQQELADSLKKLSMSEASLEVNTRYRNDLEEEKARLLKDMDRLKGKLEESEDQYVQAERRINSLKNSLDEKEKEHAMTVQKLQEALSASALTETVVKQLEEAVQRLEIENARLEAAAKQQSNKIEALQKGAQEAAMVRSHLEDLVSNLQSSKMTLEDQLSREVQKQSMLSHTAQDSQALWEEELKSRSKLGLRLAELEKEKGELSTQMEIEKKKAKKITEQKKAVDTRLDQEMKRNTELQKEMYRLRTLLKTAKKKLRDQDTGGAEFGSPMSSLRMDMGRHGQPEVAIGRMKDKVEDLQVELEKEASRRSQLEKVNGELKDQLTSLRSLGRSNDLLERSKRQLEEEVLDLRRKMETAQMEQSHVEQYRRDAEERARQELQQKLEQVNLFLQSQAASQEALDQIKATNEASLRSQMEQKIRELESQLGRARTTQQDSFNQRDSTRTELDRYRQLYTDELRLRKSLAAKLDRANNRLAEANSKLLSERSKPLMTSSITNGGLGGPSLELGALGSPANYVSTLGPLSRSLGLGLSFLSPVTDAQNSRVEDYLAKMQSELDRNISKELNNATAELNVAADRLSPVGSASRVELDPVSRATQQYLEVLKRNNMI